MRTLLNVDMHTVVNEKGAKRGLGRVVVGDGRASGVTTSDVLAVARGDARVELSPQAVAALAAAREIVDALAAEPDPVYGVSTGFGALATRHITPELRGQLQRNIVRSHAAGMGPRVEREVVRALMFLRLRTVCTGHTGVRPEVAQTMADVLNAGITPVVHEYGSLGCSGDLAPLSHCALTLMGEGDAEGPDGTVRPAGDLLAEHGIRPVELREKEGLALLNGTDGMLGMLIMALADLDTLYKSADVTAALSLEALLGTDKVLAPELHAIRPHPGQAASAANMLAVLKGSQLTGVSHPAGSARTGGTSVQYEAPRVQDAYSVRCAPQVAGAGRDTLAHARLVAERELASAVDNPVVLPGGSGSAGGRVESNGNFHGAPVGYVLDFLAIAAADLGSIAERRTDRLLDKNRSHGLPPFLADDAGVDSGLMIAQYTQAALVSEMKRLAVPASTDSIPSSAMQEDHVSMGWSAARKLRTAVDNLSRVIAVELYAATRAIELREGSAPAPASQAVVEAVRAAGVQGPGPDRFLAPDLAAADAFVRGGGLVAAVEEVTGPLR
jgi:histidine ammonia-lyase